MIISIFSAFSRGCSPLHPLFYSFYPPSSSAYSLQKSSNFFPGGLTAEVRLIRDSSAPIEITSNFDGVSYFYNWDTLAASEGNHTLKAQATDNGGALNNSPIITVNVDNVDNAPTASISNPANNSTVIKTVTIRVSATDDRGVSSASYAMDTGSFQPLVYNSSSGKWEATWDTVLEAQGPHTIYAQSVDNAGQKSTTASENVTVDNSAPTATLIKPVNGSSVSGTVLVQMSATDNLTATGSMVVEYAVDSGAWQPAVYNTASDRYEANWNTATVANGSHSLKTQAKDKGGNIGIDGPITLTVNNTTSAMYVWDIAWQENGGKGKSKFTVKVPVTIQRDSNSNNLAESTDSKVSSASVTIVITAAGTDGLFGTSDDVKWNGTGTTDSYGVTTYTWQNAPKGKYQAQVTGLTHASYQWNKTIDHDNPSSYTTVAK